MVLKKLQFGSYVIIAVMLFFCFKLWQLQVLDGDKYRLLSENNRLRIVKTPAPRGIIFDRNGMPLVKNVPFFSVSVHPDNLKDLDINALSSFLGMKKEEIEEIDEGDGEIQGTVKERELGLQQKNRSRQQHPF